MGSKIWQGFKSCVYWFGKGWTAVGKIDENAFLAFLCLCAVVWLIGWLVWMGLQALWLATGWWAGPIILGIVVFVSLIVKATRENNRDGRTILD